MKKIRLLLTVIALAACGVSFAAESASSVLDGMRRKLASAKAVEAVFTINADGDATQGSASLSGAAFVFRTPELTVWYDGKTQWSMIGNTGEVNISEPTAEELTLSNPFAILNGYGEHFKARLLTSSGKDKRVELTPIHKGTGIGRIVVTEDSSTHWPAAVEVVFSDGRRIVMTVNNINAVPPLPAATFRFDSAKYPTVEIIDLR